VTEPDRSDGFPSGRRLQYEPSADERAPASRRRPTACAIAARAHGTTFKPRLSGDALNHAASSPCERNASLDGSRPTPANRGLDLAFGDGASRIGIPPRRAAGLAAVVWSTSPRRNLFYAELRDALSGRGDIRRGNTAKNFEDNCACSRRPFGGSWNLGRSGVAMLAQTFGQVVGDQDAHRQESVRVLPSI